MNEIAELERRISAALARIGAALDALPRGSGTDADAPALSEALETERAANAQLTERVRAIKEKQEIVVTALEKKVAQLTRQLDAATRDLVRQRSVNADLVETNRMLNDAARGTLATPELVNAAMESELSALRAARAAELAEMEEIMAELKPLIGEVA
jgi:flagella basal body P-ring formation protein FlgA